MGAITTTVVIGSVLCFIFGVVALLWFCARSQARGAEFAGEIKTPSLTFRISSKPGEKETSRSELSDSYGLSERMGQQHDSDEADDE